MRKLYIIEDDEVIRSELVRIFSLIDNCAVECFENDSYEYAEKFAIDANASIYILDLNLPNSDGITISKAIKAFNSNAKIVIVTSSDSDIDEIRGMQAGVDDYITKPFNPHVLIAHIERLLREIDASLCDNIVYYKGLELDFGKSTLSFSGKTADLSRNELRILGNLVDAKGKIVSRQDLMYELWQSDRFIDDNTLTVNINRLRKTLKEVGADEKMLVTHRGQGYSI